MTMTVKTHLLNRGKSGVLNGLVDDHSLGYGSTPCLRVYESTTPRLYVSYLPTSLMTLEVPIDTERMFPKLLIATSALSAFVARLDSNTAEKKRAPVSC